MTPVKYWRETRSFSNPIKLVGVVVNDRLNVKNVPYFRPYSNKAAPRVPCKIDYPWKQPVTNHSGLNTWSFVGEWCFFKTKGEQKPNIWYQNDSKQASARTTKFKQILMISSKFNQVQASSIKFKQVQVSSSKF